MRTDYPKYFIAFFVLALLTWTLSCSGRSGKNIEAEIRPVAADGEEEIFKLIKLISPEENSGFKLKDPIKVILAAEDPKRLPDSVLIFSMGNL